MTKMDCLDPK